MTPAEAVECARLITDLWPHPPTTDVRLTLLASALEAIPSRTDAARAINDLFYTPNGSSRHQPRSSTRALGLSGIMDSSGGPSLARLAGSEVTPSQEAVTAPGRPGRRWPDWRGRPSSKRTSSIVGGRPLAGPPCWSRFVVGSAARS